MNPRFFFAELRRRNVYKVAVAYAVVAWLLIQLASIAVVPFVNMSSDKENEYFVDGLTEEILNRLAQISALKVPGRTSSFAQMLLKVGRLDAALEHANRACELDRLAWVPPSIVSFVQLSKGDLPQARAWLDRLEKLRGKVGGFALRLDLAYALSKQDASLARAGWPNYCQPKGADEFECIAP